MCKKGDHKSGGSEQMGVGLGRMWGGPLPKETRILNDVRVRVEC